MLAEEWESRTSIKLGCTALVSAIASARANSSSMRPTLEKVPGKVFGYTASMAIFCGLSEGARAIRGTHDGLNSLVAGAVTGGLVAGHFQGPQFRLLGAVLWGPICGGLHYFNDCIKPKHIFEDFMIGEGLLDPIVKERREPVPSPQEVYRSVQGDTSMDDLMKLARVIQHREVMALNSWNTQAGGQTSTSNPLPALQTSLDTRVQGSSLSTGGPLGEEEEEIDEEDFQLFLQSSGLEQAVASVDGEPGKQGTRSWWRLW
eukprot:gene28253-31359_t